MLEDSKTNVNSGPKEEHPVVGLIDNICSEHQISMEQINDFLNDTANFSSAQWLEIQTFKKKLEDDLACAIANIIDPEETKSKYKDLQKAQQWIFVR